MRYSRQETFLKNIKNFTPNFQNSIKNKKIIIVGCGGVGSVLAQLLVRGGFLNITLIDNDIVDETNLQRQIYFEENLGELKVNALKEILIKIDKNANIKTFQIIIDEININKIALNSDLIIDSTDNFHTRKIINNYCETNKKDWMYNGAVMDEIISGIFYGKDKIFNKIFNKKINDVSCCNVGVLASTTHICASLAYNNTLKYFLNMKEKKLIKINLWNNKLHEINLNKIK